MLRNIHFQKWNKDRYNIMKTIRNVKLLKCVSLICLSPLFVFYSSLNYDGPRAKALT